MYIKGLFNECKTDDKKTNQTAHVWQKEFDYSADSMQYINLVRSLYVYSMDIVDKSKRNHHHLVPHRTAFWTFFSSIESVQNNLSPVELSLSLASKLAPHWSVSWNSKENHFPDKIKLKLKVKVKVKVKIKLKI